MSYKTLNELLVLSSINNKAIHGYQIAKEIEVDSEGYFKVPSGTLYPILTRFENDGLIIGEWENTDKNRKRKNYLLSEKGKLELAERVKNWRKFFTNLFGVIGTIK
jgi:PadR family transcriptional regulator